MVIEKQNLLQQSTLVNESLQMQAMDKQPSKRHLPDLK
jgi:hypothetical protein